MLSVLLWARYTFRNKFVRGFCHPFGSVRRYVFNALQMLLFAHALFDDFRRFFYAPPSFLPLAVCCCWFGPHCAARRWHGTSPRYGRAGAIVRAL